MDNEYNEKQPLTLTANNKSLADIKTATMSVSSQQTFVEQDGLFNVEFYDNFTSIAKDVKFNIEECYYHVQRIQEAQKAVFEHTIDEDDTAKRNRDLLKSQTAKAIERLEYIRRAINLIEPSKPKLSNLDLRNQQFKSLLRSFKDLLEKYISVILESQRFTSVLFESLIRQVNPQATSFDLERAIRSTGDDSPSILVQILMQRGVRKNDKRTQIVMHAVQEVHQDLSLLAHTFSRLSEMRNGVNLVIERYRQRWPVVLKEGKHVYVIDDNLNLLEQTLVGKHIDFEVILRQRERRNRILVGFISLAILLFVIFVAVFTTAFSELYGNHP